MSDTGTPGSTDPTGGELTIPATSQPATDTGGKPEEKTTDWQAEARKWEARAKENKAAQAELDRIKASQMSETEKITAAAKAAETERDEARRELLRYRAAAKHGISAEDADLFLTGTDEDTIERQAKALVAKLGDQTKALVAKLGDQTKAGNKTTTEGTGQAGAAGSPLQGDVAVFANWLNEARR
jgi:hypothetical protein